MAIDRKRSMAVMMSARANAYYLQHAKVCQDGDRVVYLMREKDTDKMFNIPDKNTAFVFLGKGCSITDSAARKLAESGVLIGFCGNGGSPLFSAISPVFLEPYSEYRPTEYMQSWCIMWFNEEERLNSGRFLLESRIEIVLKTWGKILPEITLSDLMIQRFQSRIKLSPDAMNLLTAEAEWAKGIYALLAHKYKISDFQRDNGKGLNNTTTEHINSLIDHGNYIAYGYAGVALTTLGISYAFPLLHGKTRRGALVFDIADLIKDAIVLPLAFKLGKEGVNDQEFRYQLIDLCWENNVIDILIDTIKKVIKK